MELVALCPGGDGEGKPAGTRTRRSRGLMSQLSWAMGQAAQESRGKKRRLSGCLCRRGRTSSVKVVGLCNRSGRLPLRPRHQTCRRRFLTWYERCRVSACCTPVGRLLVASVSGSSRAASVLLQQPVVSSLPLKNLPSASSLGMARSVPEAHVQTKARTKGRKEISKVCNYDLAKIKGTGGRWLHLARPGVLCAPHRRAGAGCPLLASL